MTELCMLDQRTESATAQKLFRKYPAKPSLKLTVILPVRNEEDNLVRTLDALNYQFDNQGVRFNPEDYEVLLLANNCNDRSVEIALDYQRQNTDFQLHIEDIYLPADIAHIGTVRRLLMDAAYDRFANIGRHDGVIASTDSDSEVDKLWVYQTLQEINKGNDVVGGRIFTRPVHSISRLYYLRDITYKHLVSKLEDMLDPVANDRWPRHFQCFGASFAVTCGMYDRCGRLPVVPFLEDMAFHRSLIRVDAKIRLSPFVQVFTSDRIDGRVDFGLSIQLKQWGEMKACHDPIMVEPAYSLIIKLKARRMLRDIWIKNYLSENEKTRMLSNAGNILNIDCQWITEQLQRAVYFGTLWETIDDRLKMQGWAETWPLVDIVDAIPDLKRQIAMLDAYVLV
jgi:hypothetical protein